MKRGLFSKTRIEISKNDKSKAISLILREGLKYKYSFIGKSGELIIVLYTENVKPFKSLFLENSIEAQFTVIDGFLSNIGRLKSRYGLLVGLVIVILLVNLSKNVVWKINVTGNTYVDDKEIVKELENIGFTYGTYIPGLDYDKLHNEFLLKSDKISWISVNITGNVANVLVKESIEFEKSPEILYSNIVAESDAQIQSIIVINGKKTVSIGDIVKKGQLLVSGIVDSQSQGAIYERAQGEIKAYVNKEISIQIPLKSSKKVYTGKSYKDYNYKIFNFPIKIASKCRNSECFYDTIEKREMLKAFGVFDLPISVKTTGYYEYVNEDVCYTLNEAMDLAFQKLKDELNYALKDSELISKQLVTSYDDEYFYIKCNLYCLEDIAKEQIYYYED